MSAARFSHVISPALLLACMASGPSTAAAANLDLCNDVLRQDIFNRTSTASQASESAKNTYLQAFFELGEDAAYDQYKSAFSDYHKSRTSIDAEFHYVAIGGEFKLDLERAGGMSKDEFKVQYNQHKSQRQSNASGSSEHASSLISNYESSVRDANTLESWRQCMLSRTSDPSIVAYGHRDDADNAYVTVMWIPGRALASVAPEVEVRFVPASPDVVVELGQSWLSVPRIFGGNTVKLAPGSGTAFVLRFKNPNSAARYQSFAVLVNAVARNGRTHLMDFHEPAIVPAAGGEVPCDLLVQPGRNYAFWTSMPALGAETAAIMKDSMVLGVLSLAPGGGASGREYTGQVSFSPEFVQKVLKTHFPDEPADRYERRVGRFMRSYKAWIKTNGTTLEFKMENFGAGMGDLGSGRCTSSAAEGSFPGRVAVNFNISAKR